VEDNHGFGSQTGDILIRNEIRAMKDDGLRCGDEASAACRNRQTGQRAYQSSHRRNTRLAFVPPKPKLLDKARRA
jgi:hypothetical protein